MKQIIQVTTGIIAVLFIFAMIFFPVIISIITGNAHWFWLYPIGIVGMGCVGITASFDSRV